MVVLNNLQMNETSHIHKNGDGVPKSLSRKFSEILSNYKWLLSFSWPFACCLGNPNLEQLKKGTYLVKVRKRDYRRYYQLDDDLMAIAYSTSFKADTTTKKRSRNYDYLNLWFSFNLITC